MRTEIPPIANPMSPEVTTREPASGRPDCWWRNVIVVLLVPGLLFIWPPALSFAIDFFVILPAGAVVWGIAESDYGRGFGGSLVTGAVLGIICFSAFG